MSPPRFRAVLEADPSDGIDMPRAFWLTITPMQFWEMFYTGMIGPELSARLWRFAERPGIPPTRMILQTDVQQMKAWMEKHESSGIPELDAAKAAEIKRRVDDPGYREFVEGMERFFPTQWVRGADGCWDLEFTGLDLKKQ